MDLTSEELYDQLADALSIDKPARVIHLLNAVPKRQTQQLEELAQAELQGPLSLYRMVKSLVRRDINNRIRLR